MAEEKDIYIKLMEDITGMDNIDPKASIFDEEINANMVKSCQVLAEILGVAKANDAEKISVGINDEKHLEPCPIAYTGKLNGKNFRSVFIGLNPYSEGPRDDFPDDMTWGDLANIHHPNDIWYGYSDDRYIPLEDTKKKFPRNNYWRVYGNKEGNRKWSDYYRLIFPIHVALHWNEINETFGLKQFSIWSEFKKSYKNDKEVTNTILQILEKFPIANFEAIPYKSAKYNTKNFQELFTRSNICHKYMRYLTDFLQFIDNYAKKDAYIIISSKVADMDTVADVFRNIMKKIPGSTVETMVKGAFNKKSNKFEPNSNREKHSLAPLYLFYWNNRRVIISSPISMAEKYYSWIYNIPFEFADVISGGEMYRHQ